MNNKLINELFKECRSIKGAIRDNNTQSKMIENMRRIIWFQAIAFDLVVNEFDVVQKRLTAIEARLNQSDINPIKDFLH